MRDLYLVALVLLAGFAGTVIEPAQEKTSAQNRPVPATQTATDPDRPEGPLNVLCSSVKDRKCEIRPELPESGFRVVVALVPDPERTNLRLYFDRAIEAIENAAQDTGYTLFKYSLPWQTEPSHAYGQFDDDSKAEAKRRAKAAYPGVLAFRSNTGGPTLSIFLVGESPTEGYRVEQMKHALDFESQLAPSSDPIRVLGPSFSGTLSMLERAVGAPPELATRTWVIDSGTASTGAAWQSLTGYMQKKHLQGTATIFTRTSETTSWALNDFLTQRLRFYGTLPLLSEGGTVFGNMENFRRRLDSGKVEQGMAFRFPRGLSHVRQAYQKSPGLNQNPDLAQDRRGLALSSDSEDGRDQVPEFANDSPVSHDAELSAIADSLQHEQLQYSAVVATDMLDLLFVANYLRTSVPDTRLVLLDADLLQTLPSTDGSLQGSIVVGTYPIYAESQQWINRQARVFSSQFEEGVYSAAAALASTGHDNLAPLRGDLMAAQKGDDQKDQAVFWISAIGKDALWPVALRFHPDVLMPPGAETLRRFLPASAPRYWLTLAVALTMVVIAWFAAFVTAQKGGDSPYQWCADLSLHSSRGNLAGRAYYISGLTLAIASVWLSVTACQIGFFLDAPRENLWLGLVPMLGALVLTAFASILSFGALREFRAARMQSSVQYVSMYILPWIIFLAYVAGLGHAIWPRATEEGFFFALRSLELGSGVCPALPFLFISLAFVLFSWTQLQRVVFADERYAIPPDLSDETPIISLRNVVADLNTTLRSPLLEQPATALWSSLVAFAFSFLFGVRCLRSLEGQPFDYAYAFAVAALCFGLVLVALRFWNSWRKLQALLEQLGLHSIREAFGLLPEDCTWSPIWQQNPRKRNYQLLAHSIEALEEISRIPGVPAFDLEDIRKPARELLDCVAQGSRERLAIYKLLQDELAEVAKTLAPALAGPARKQVEAFYALRFLTYIRYVMLHLRNLLTFVTFGYVLLALSLGSYPFLAPRATAWFLSLLLIGLSIPVVLTFLQMSRNTVLSKLSTDESGKSDWSVTARTASFAALPLLSMLASHFPFVGRYVFSWLQPALKSLH